MKDKKTETKSFNFKKFSIYGGQSGMPVSTDGVLLGAWVSLPQRSCVLDIGTGTGLLALMAAQRFEDASISAIDIDQHAIDAAIVNIEQSPWQDRISLHHGSVLTTDFSQRFDAIICNPPYFNSGEQAQQSQRATARHTNSLDHLELAQRCFEITTDAATASFILPTTEGEGFIKLAQQCGWYLAKRLDVKTTDRKPAIRVLFELSKDPVCEQDLQRESLTIHHDGGYSEAFIALTKDFYLKM
ncbi:tRNA1(Val) (adenine(37)-N6)-methyltransferase [Vibrio splendidus]|uniref:tRNA1(Val) (adenine(37)-N6)-methyltransferase n=1 Tax=Vibrio splendidus TaxID=29497 RepID=A0A2T5EM21_VIBSP|nr:methyltransferase [Vibrio splendidus]MDH5888101.1 methyltransferase [Vibrio splendidus]OEE64220.1 tRNA (adenosine(37)-N6)-methyltransferase TrmM [Vibrio splendidus FF-6]PMN80087.1 tRNA (adenosine(37)-N6)-methyltransferase TrmM [Vibrio splendidus]PTP21922.1 tRNA (adenosine(37)-N6)-methyltransferase TrmM [Vibrio splendidus]PTP30075.1 tRNA (adenosine(37)-N6)-methyltransferase TrmM [Vibrio splendidus]